MIFDTAIVAPVYGLVAIAVFGVTALALILFVRLQPKSFLVHGSSNIYYAGIVLAGSIALSSMWFVGSWKLAGGLLAALALVTFVGTIDERKKLSARTQLLAQAAIAGISVYAGWVIPYISNPIEGGVIFLNIPIWGIIPGALLAFIWIIACMNAMNFLDGTDGLAPAIGAIACIALAGISMLPATQDARTFVLAVIGLGALSAFFLWNAPPAKVYLGTTGSWCIGLFIALVAMIGGGKISTTLIVLAIPMLDALFVIGHRIIAGQVPWKGDTTRHLHYRLAYAGLSKWNIVIIMSICTLLFACIGVFVSTTSKIITLSILAGVFFFVSARMMNRRTL
ncbi:MAG: hypothetical protein A3E36_02190 [Candidatus Andersenbacteria bacterium RIFCSPHIGHO2_12_FULL_45_11b]|uniref:Undecaprenyl-phosphate alpha-N-acetylglucosaminyl 1-phosphate transferase n=1 Tax=Candidatus Andersenbacteria bacterium RIFCSPHIGHO2_12_FULL_45_11b TaxID=1797282 RepID=A0A1G1XD04_9BACT|nr:MAG: hypothetical protein A3E36_02190 [Candidatus Andersenbacteria bacterium RIFCSPHIGHO2_12_FULL_45_11b]